MKTTLTLALVMTSVCLFVAACDDDDDDGDEGAPAAKSSALDQRCLPDGGYVDNECDSCENAACCATRFGCYDNASCDAANKAFDDCLTSANKDPAKVASCWSTFSGSSSVAKARVDCQRTHCKSQCAVP
jgi:hypothetical protein